MSPRRRGLYSLLAVPRGADDAVIRSAYRRRALATHPDKGGLADEFLEVVEAFEVLSDRLRRFAYDADLERSGSLDGLDRGAQAAAVAEEGNSSQRPSAPEAVPAGEGSGPAEDRRVSKLWSQIMELPPDARPSRIAALSFRTAERLLEHLEARAGSGAAPVVAGDAPPVAPAPLEAIGPQEAERGAGLAPPHGDGSKAGEGPAGEADDGQSCGTGLLASLPASSSRGGTAAEVQSQASTADSAGGGEAAGEEAPPPKRLRSLEARRSDVRGGSRAWVSLDHLKICTGSSQDLAEAINWHIMIVRIKQLFQEQTRKGCAFDDALRGAVKSVLADRAQERSSDPRLRYVNEYTLAGTLFTPVTSDLDTALRQRAELRRLRERRAPREEVQASIRRLTAASAAVLEEEIKLMELLRQQLRSFSRSLRWQGARPEGINAAFVGSDGPARVVAAYAEVWRPAASGELELSCRGPRRRRVPEALADLSAIRAAQASGGDAAAKLESRRLYEQEMRRAREPPAATPPPPRQQQQQRPDRKSVV